MARRGFDPGNFKWYDNMKEHITKQADKNLESKTKKLVQDMQQPKEHKSKPSK